MPINTPAGLHREAGSSPGAAAPVGLHVPSSEQHLVRVVAAVTERMRSVSNTRLPGGTSSANPLISRPAEGQGCYTMGNCVSAAKRRGRVGGRPPALTAAQKREVWRMRDEEGRALQEIASLLFKISVRTVRRA